MNVQEQHIEINLSSQKIASNVFRKFDPSEIDWILNKMVDRFIKDRIKEDKDSLGFDATEIDLDALRTLVVLDRTLESYKLGTDQEVWTDLPGDYSYLIDDYSGVVDKCSIYYNSATKFSNRTVYLYQYKLTQSAKTEANYYQAINLTFDGTAILDQSGLSGLQNKSELFTFRNYVLNQLWNKQVDGVEFYWEKFDNVYLRDTIIAVATTQRNGNMTISIDGQASAAAISANIVRAYPTQLSTGIKNRNNRLIRGQVRSNVLNGTFTGTRKESPISAISGNKLKVYHDESFIVNRLKISYIKKPRKISLSLAQDCDLPEEFHMQICDMAVLYVKELTMSPDWEIKLQDNMLNKN